MEKPGIEPATPGLQGIGLSTTPRRLGKFSLFVANPYSRNRYESAPEHGSRLSLQHEILLV